ncbi:MAG TPA: hypothetical protein VE988_28420 [Gemmataceae bacterium]|nr:hypothetical protein [Gemmataceae bacterium]
MAVPDAEPPLEEEVVEAKPARPAPKAKENSIQRMPARPARDIEQTDDDEPRPRRRDYDDREDDDQDESFDDEPRRPKKKKSGKRNRADLKAIALYQKVVLLCLLVYIIAVVAQFAFPPEIRLLLGLAMLGVGITAAVFVFLLALKVYSPGVGIALAILTLIPCAGLIAILVINGKATAGLKKNGISVGLLGASFSDIS